jgi:hypothetical protein
VFDKAKSYLTTKPIPGRARGAYGPASQAEGLVPPNIRDDTGLAWAKTKEMFRKPAPKGLYEQIGYDAGGAHPAIVRNQAMSAKAGVIPAGTNNVNIPGFENHSPYREMPRMSGKDYEAEIQKAMDKQEAMRAAGTMPQIAESKQPQKGWVKPPNGVVTQDIRPHSAVMPFRPTVVSQPPPMAANQDMLSTRVASEVNMNYYEQGYADQMVRLGLYKDAGLRDLAGKARDLGSRALGKSKATVEARRANITSGRQAVTAAKDEKMLGEVRNKYKTKVDKIKGTPKAPPAAATAPTPPAAAAAPPPITPPAGTEAEGPGNWEKFKNWWGERKPWQQVGMGAGVALPVGAGLYMAGKDNPPSLAQQQMGYTPQY